MQSYGGAMPSVVLGKGLGGTTLVPQVHDASSQFATKQILNPMVQG